MTICTQPWSANWLNTEEGVGEFLFMRISNKSDSHKPLGIKLVSPPLKQNGSDGLISVFLCSFCLMKERERRKEKGRE